MRFNALWYLIGGVLLGGIVVGSLVPVPRLSPTFNDKLIHFLIYFLLMTWFGQLQRQRVLLALGFVAMGFIIELLQGQTRYRTFEWYDLLANTAGIAVAWVCLMTPFGKMLSWLDRWLQRKMPNTP